MMKRRWLPSTTEAAKVQKKHLGRHCLGLAKYLDEVVKPLDLEVIEKSEERRKFRAGGNFYN